MCLSKDRLTVQWCESCYYTGKFWNIAQFSPDLTLQSIHKQDPDRACVVGAVIIIRGAYYQIPDAVVVYVPDIGNRDKGY